MTMSSSGTMSSRSPNLRRRLAVFTAQLSLIAILLGKRNDRDDADLARSESERGVRPTLGSCWDASNYPAPTPLTKPSPTSGTASTGRSPSVPTASSTSTLCPAPPARTVSSSPAATSNRNSRNGGTEQKSTIVAQPPSPGVHSVLVDISCVSTTNCYAAGSNTIEHWNGTSWSIVTHAYA